MGSDVAQKSTARVKYSLLLSYHMYSFTKLHKDEGLRASGEVRGRIKHCKSGTNYTPAATSSLIEFRIGSCEKSSANQTPKLFQEDLVVIPPQVEQMGELANQRPFFKLKCRRTIMKNHNQICEGLYGIFNLPHRFSSEKTAGKALFINAYHC